ncbi:hypothetical protein CRX72_05390 [Pantoea sp. BRM17]|nr:hypothetical protein CRX72_05390 [Pantoea sp. BRM17]
MTGEAALRSGAGLVRVLTQADNIGPLITARPELMVDAFTREKLHNALAWADVVAIGPGSGLLTGKARDHVGELHCDTLGLDAWLSGQQAPVRRYAAEHLTRWLKPRQATSHKGDHGQLLIIGGDVIVDALLGTGLSRAPAAPYAPLIEAINQHTAPVLAIDVPSGLLATTGATPGAAVVASRTLSMIALKMCGHGNNGGDGYVIARLAQAAGMAVTLLACEGSRPLPDEARQAREAWLDAGGEIHAADSPWPEQVDDMRNQAVDANARSLPHSVWPAQAMAQLEQDAADSLGLTLYELMQRAGQASFTLARQSWPEAGHWLIRSCGRARIMPWRAIHAISP